MRRLNRPSFGTYYDHRMTVLLFGGTGHLGRDLTHAALSEGISLRVVSRHSRPPNAPEALGWSVADLATGEGVSESLEGEHTVIFAAGNPKNHAAVEVEGMRRLMSSAIDREVAHIIFVSIVGVDRLPVPYYRTKVAAERIIAGAGIPYTILRATQFHYFVDMMLSALGRVPFLLPVPKGFRVQPVATSDVAHRVLRCLAEGPKGLLPDFGGPEVFPVEEAASLWRDAVGSRKAVLPVPVPGGVGSAFRRAYNTNADGELGTLGWREWLAQRYPSAPR